MLVRPPHCCVVSAGVEVITAPINITAQYLEPLMVPGKVTVTFWENSKDQNRSSAPGLRFHMQQHGSNRTHVKGLIFRSEST